MIHHENEIIENSLDKTQSNTELTVANTTNHSLKCDIDNSSSNNLTTKISCTFIQGHGQCGKRYLRRPIRDAIAEKLKKTTAMAYRIQIAEDLMNESDTIETPHLFSANVLRTAKNKIAEEDYLDKDPLKSLLLMQLGSLYTIQNLGMHLLPIQ